MQNQQKPLPARPPLFAGCWKTGIFPLVLAWAVVYIFSQAFFPVTGIDTDIYWHLASGKRILQEGGIQPGEVFSHTMAGRLYVDYAWLQETGWFLLHRYSGIGGLILFKALYITFIYLLFFFFLFNHSGRPWLSLAGVLLTFQTLSIFGGKTTQFISILFFIILMHILSQYEKKSRYYLLVLLPLLFLVWANSHALFVIGLAYLGLWTLLKIAEYRFIRQRGDRVKSTLLPLLLSMLVSCAATFLNPYGYKLYTVIIAHVHSAAFVKSIKEYYSPSLGESTFALYWLVVVLSMVASVISLRKKELASGIILLIFTLWSFWAVRNMVFFMLVFIPVGIEQGALLIDWLISRLRACPFFSQISRKTCNAPGGGGLAGIIQVLLLSGLAAFLFFTLRTSLPAERHVNRLTLPVDAVEFIRLNGISGNMFNCFNWGGYLIWELYPQCPVFIDARVMVLFTDDNFAEYNKVMSGKGWQEIFHKYDIQVVLLSKGETGLLLDELKKARDLWEVVYEDYNSCLVLKKSVDTHDFFDRLSRGQVRMPKTAYYYFLAAVNAEKINKPRDALENYTQSIRLYPYNPNVRVSLAFLYARTGRLNEAREEFERALAMDRNMADAHLGLGMLFELKGEFHRARREYREALRIEPGNVPARDALERIKI